MIPVTLETAKTISGRLSLYSRHDGAAFTLIPTIQKNRDLNIRKKYQPVLHNSSG
jgi:hypothetical protein